LGDKNIKLYLINGNFRIRNIINSNWIIIKGKTRSRKLNWEIIYWIIQFKVNENNWIIACKIKIVII